MSNLAKEALLPTLDCERETIDFLCGVETDFWAMMILKKEEREIDNQRIKELKEEILDLDTNETDRINQIQKQIEEIERNKSANLVEKLQQKTRVLLQANRVSLQNSISPASIEPDITTTNQQTDSAGGVFNQTLEPNPSLFSLLRELESRISQIELSVDVVALTEIAQQELQPRSNLRPQSAPPNTNSDSSIARPRAVPRARTNAGEASTSPRNSKNNCCVIN